MNKYKILYILHSFNNRAGTEFHTKDLARALSEEYLCGFLYPENGYLHLDVPKTNEHISLPVTDLSWPVVPTTDPSWKTAIEQLAGHFCPTIIHVQHLHNYPLSTLEQLRSFTPNLLISFHDYFYITPFFTMQGIEDPAEAFSESYVKKIFGADIREHLLARKEIFSAAFENIKLKIVPSQYLASVMNKVYPGAYRVIPHGIHSLNLLPNLTDNKTPIFGYVGSLLPQKGWRELVKAFCLLHQDYPESQLHFWGGGEPPPPMELPGITFHGTYEREDLPKILEQFDIGIIPSLFAETFSLVLSELWYAGKTVAVSDIGSLGERVEDNVNGKKFIPGDLASMVAALRFFLTDTSWRNWKTPNVRLHHEMVAEYKEIYQQK
jgi:glycosyltransferase involved in cell wall biosynthesis